MILYLYVFLDNFYIKSDIFNEEGYTIIEKKYKECPVYRSFNIISMISAFEKVYDSDYSFEGESHDFWEVMVVLDGNISVAVDSNIFKLQKNEIVFLNPFEFHNMCSINGTNPHVLIMSVRLTQPFKVVNQVVTISDSMKQDFVDLLSFAKKIFNFKGICVDSVKEEKSIDAQIFINKLETLLLSVIEHHHNAATQITTRCAMNYSRIIKILKNNVDKNLTIKQIAELANMSQSNIKKTFSMYANQGIMNYFSQLKIIEAKKMLEAGFTVGEASQRLGFSEQNYFSNVFKKSTGYSPKNWLRIG